LVFKNYFMWGMWCEDFLNCTIVFCIIYIHNISIKFPKCEFNIQFSVHLKMPATCWK
jgi:hypothetical protein